MTYEKAMDWGATLVANALIVAVYLLATYVLSGATKMSFWQSLIVVRLICEAGTQIKTNPYVK